MILSAVSVLVVAQSSSEIPEGLTNNPVHIAADLSGSISAVDFFKLIPNPNQEV